jgi:hypothetical protein
LTEEAPEGSIYPSPSDRRTIVYCPNCGRSNAETPDASCAKCGLPLGPVVAHLESHKSALVEFDKLSRERNERLLAIGLFLGTAAVPIGVAVRNLVQTKK